MLALPFLFWACSSDISQGDSVRENNNAIRFHASVEGMTRGEYKTDLSNMTAFKVAALTNVATSPEVYFSPMEVTHEADGTWKNTVTYFWPPQSLKFYAYAPADLPVTIDGTKQTMTNFTVATKPVSQKDVITAWQQGVRATPPATNGPVPLNFRHALARVEVRATNPSDTRIDVLGVKICRIPATGSMTMQQSADTYAEWTVQGSTERDFMIKGDKEASDERAVVTLMKTDTESKSLMFGQGGWLMLPQQLTPWTAGPNADGAYLAVLCTIHDGAGRLLFPDEEGKYGFTAVPISTKWEAGHRYVYTLNFFANGGSAGVLSPDPYSPDDPNHVDPDIDDTPGGNRQGGDIVVNSPITFSVEISDWLNSSTDNSDIDF